jgi:hypothetical protein
MNDDCEFRATQRRWRQWIVAGFSLLAVIGVALCAWATRDRNYASRLEKQIRVEVPLGSTEHHLDVWLSHHAKYLPTKLPGNQAGSIQGHSIVQLAGMTEQSVADVVRVTFPRSDWISDHLRAYFFLDRDRQVMGYYFLTFQDLARMETAHQLVMR